MGRRISRVLSFALLTAMTIGVSAPTSAAQPELVINDMDATGTIFEVEFDYDGDHWVLTGEFGFVVADFVRYRDGSFARPHTDSDVRMCAFPAGSASDPGNSPYYLAGTAPLDFHTDTGVIETLEFGVLQPITVNLSNSAGTITAVVVVEGTWDAYGAIEKLRSVEPGVGALIGKRRNAEVAGSIDFESGDGPFAALEGVSLDLKAVSGAAFLDNYDEVYLGN